MKKENKNKAVPCPKAALWKVIPVSSSILSKPSPAKTG